MARRPTSTCYQTLRCGFARSIGLTGTKFGCGVAMCGACTVFLDGKPLRSCTFPVASLGAREITTIEGLSGKEATAVQRAWANRDVPQCGYCQSGQVMSAIALLKEVKRPSDRDIDLAMNGNVSRCATYVVSALRSRTRPARWRPDHERPIAHLSRRTALKGWPASSSASICRRSAERDPPSPRRPSRRTPDRAYRRTRHGDRAGEHIGSAGAIHRALHHRRRELDADWSKVRADVHRPT